MPFSDCYDDNLSVDYAKSLYEIYEDVINFEHNPSKLNKGPSRVTARSTKESMINIMHFSQVVQQSLGGPIFMKQDFVKVHPHRTFPIMPELPVEWSDAFNAFKVLGVVSGKITILGPTHNDIVVNPMSTKTWAASLPKSDANIVELREKNEGFIRVLLSLGKSNLAKVFSINTYVSWKADEGRSKPSKEPGVVPITSINSTVYILEGITAKLPHFAVTREDEDPEKQVLSDVPRLFLTETGAMGLVSSDARENDMIYQFRDCDIAAVVRKNNGYMRIVGRAVVANERYMEKSKFRIPKFKEFDFDKNGSKLFMDMRTLQLMTE